MLFQWMNSSIIKRVTVWYTLFFSLITIIIFTGIYTISNYYLTSQEESNLSFVVKDAVQDYENDEPFESFDDGVYLSLYSIDGTLMPLLKQRTLKKLIPIRERICTWNYFLLKRKYGFVE